MKYFIIISCCFVVCVLIIIIPIIEGILKAMSLQSRKKQRHKCLQCNLMGYEYLEKINKEDIENVDCCYTCYPTVPSCRHEKMSPNEFLENYVQKKSNKIEKIKEEDPATLNNIEEESLF
ncbi:Hypothetical protein SRAE_2000217600 [Strongyloides ratti]|uniref:Uncharacterized protein n=1 Tax=Strongyloides ratti TaxID=34506 RepID=A0A090MYN9_STRRB|nr:Hypothetical protein SRAE_2000217600 [Strongyloides ratti]CEF67514.1 Hypothetical protein SRAE_2000217600 [Strongyloides ratti]